MSTPDPVQILSEVLFETPSRLIQDALAEATASYWMRRAATFEAARPKPGDFHGFHATPETIDALDQRIAAKAAACRARAYVTDLHRVGPTEQAEIRRLLGAAA